MLMEGLVLVRISAQLYVNEMVAILTIVPALRQLVISHNITQKSMNVLKALTAVSRSAGTRWDPTLARAMLAMS